MKLKILVAEPDETFANAIAYVLEQAGFEAVAAHDSRLALDQARTFRPDLCILSAALPAISQYQLCCDLRRDTTVCLSAPILMFGSDAHEDTQSAMLNCGVDAYMVKPFGMREMIARVFVLLRRPQVSFKTMSERELTALRVGHFTFDLSERTLTIEGANGSHTSRVTQIEARLLHLLLMNSGNVVTRETILERVWGIAGPTRARTSLDNVIAALRRKVEAESSNPKHIVAVHGVGFRFLP